MKFEILEVCDQVIKEKKKFPLSASPVCSESLDKEAW
jgi:hypothetical protein